MSPSRERRQCPVCDQRTMLQRKTDAAKGQSVWRCQECGHQTIAP
ncbi:hypothetical protein [Rathayibacter sp. Leaf248]|nr:hypothetical protein [Rathayibacter sp. Leaf248]